MSGIAIITDSNSGITNEHAKRLGVSVLPMPFTIDGEDYFEDVNLTQDQFYEKLMGDSKVMTSQLFLSLPGLIRVSLHFGK